MQKHTEIVDTTPTDAPEQRASIATAVGVNASAGTRASASPRKVYRIPERISCSLRIWYAANPWA